MASITVVTPTIGTQHLSTCVNSISKQSTDVEHWIICDGREHQSKVEDALSNVSVKVIVLPYNTGHDKWNGHRIYAACTWLCISKYIAFLDEDNTVSRSHYQKLYEACEKYDLDWAYSLRKIVDADGNIVCSDLCESLGYLHSPYDRPGEIFIDTSSFLIRTDVAKQLCLSWNHKVIADRYVSRDLSDAFPKYRCSNAFSLRYRIRATSKDYFTRGNALLDTVMRPLVSKPVLFVCHFDPYHTERVLENDCDDPYREYQQTNYKVLQRRYHLIDGYKHGMQMRPGDTLLVQFVHTETLPWKILVRADIIKILYTVESPNIRHTMQWDDLLLDHFTHIYSFWTTLCRRVDHVTYAPMTTHFIDVDDSTMVRTSVINNACADTERSVCMLLENRALQGVYVVRDTLLHAQDYLRHHFIKDLDDCVVYGTGWVQTDLGPGVKIGHTLGKTHDTARSIDILKRYVFAVIVENCDASGYVSEKIYDCFATGTIPVYYGNIVPDVRIPFGTYIDAREFSTSRELCEHLKTVDVAALRRNISRHRMNILKTVSCGAFADLIDAKYGQPGRLTCWRRK